MPYWAGALAALSVLAAIVPDAAFAREPSGAPTLSVTEVRRLIVRPDCGGVSDATSEGVALRERMVAKLRHESGLRGTDLLHPYAIRDETEGRAVKPVPTTYEAAVAEAEGRIARGHVLGVGLGQITWTKNLLADFQAPDIATAVRLAFQPCAAVRAAVRHYAADVRHAVHATRVLDCASASYNAGPGRVCEETPYVRSVRALQAALPSVPDPLATRPASGVLVPDAPSPPESRPPTSPFVKRTAGRSFTYGNQEQAP